MQLSVRAHKGTATADDVMRLRNMVNDARNSGRDFWEDLGFKGKFTGDEFQFAVPDQAMRNAMRRLAEDGVPTSTRPGARLAEDTLPPPSRVGEDTLPPPSRVGEDTLPPPRSTDGLEETRRFGDDGRPLADGPAGRAHQSLDEIGKHDMGRGYDSSGRPLADGPAGRAHDALDEIAKHDMGRGFDSSGRPLADGPAGRAHESLDEIAKHDMGSGPAWVRNVDDGTVKQLKDFFSPT